MKVKALLNLPKCIDGKIVGPFIKDKAYDLANDIAEKFINSAMFERIIDAPPKKETTAIVPPLVAENKADKKKKAD